MGILSIPSSAPVVVYLNNLKYHLMHTHTFSFLLLILFFKNTYASTQLIFHIRCPANSLHYYYLLIFNLLFCFRCIFFDTHSSQYFYYINILLLLLLVNIDDIEKHVSHQDKRQVSIIYSHSKLIYSINFSLISEGGAPLQSGLKLSSPIFIASIG